MKIDKSEIELTLTPEDIGDLITLNNFYQGLIYYCMEHIDNFDDVVQAYMHEVREQRGARA